MVTSYHFIMNLSKTSAPSSMSITHILSTFLICFSFFLDWFITPVLEKHLKLFQWNICRPAFHPFSVGIKFGIACTLNTRFIYPPVISKAFIYPILAFLRNYVLCLIRYIKIRIRIKKEATIYDKQTSIFV